jgi:hypothetical protein
MLYLSMHHRKRYYRRANNNPPITWGDPFSNRKKAGRRLASIVNYHPRSAWLDFSATGRKGKNTSVLSTLNLHPGAKHPVFFARIILSPGISRRWIDYKVNPIKKYIEEADNSVKECCVV